MPTFEQRGLAPRRLTRISEVFNADIGKGVIPGAVALIARHGKLAYLEAFGFRDRERQLPMAEFGQGFGLGFCVRKEPGRSPVPGSVGDFCWSGVHGTYFWVDPQEQLIGVLMLCAPDLRRHYRALMRHLVYQALED